jgi:ubiquinone/menaquinone biosynthesis C-methylase UbiE
MDHTNHADHFNHKKQEKLENPDRLAELNPAGTLARIGIGTHEVFCDIGAGSGIFTVAAARMTDGIVHALEIDDEMLGLIRQKANAAELGNINAVKVEAGKFPVGDSEVDLALLVTVLHEIDDKPSFLAESRRILKSGARMAVIEFFGTETPMGPPLQHRISREDAVNAMELAGFAPIDSFDLGENLYCMVFRTEKERIELQ